VSSKAVGRGELCGRSDAAARAFLSARKSSPRDRYRCPLPTGPRNKRRLWLAGFGLVFCGVAAAITAVTGPAWLAVAFAVLAVAAVVDLVVVVRRKRRGEPG